MQDLYQEELMDIFKNPHNRGAMNKPSVSVSKKNPMCGDELTLQLEIENGVVKDAKFDGSACSVSVISSSIFTDYLIGKKISEVKKLGKEDLLGLINLNLTTSRVACATLILSALQEALNNYEKGKQKSK
jgi:nitrogen fixation protein NifU and related proteins